MPPPNKRKKQAQGAASNSILSRQAQAASEEEKVERFNKFVDVLQHINSHVDSLKNCRGRVRPVDENKMVVLVFRREMEIMMARCEGEGDEYCTGMSLNKVYESVADTLKMDRAEVKRLTDAFCNSPTAGTTKSIEPVKLNTNRGKGSPNAKEHGKVTKDLRLKLVNYIDKKHAKGRKVSRKEIRNWLRKKEGVVISGSAIGRTMVSLGLSYKASKNLERSNNAARIDQIRDYLIDLSKWLKEEEEGDAVLVYTDETYCHTNHSDSHSWHLNTGRPNRNKSSSRGRRIIIMHAITKDGPLCEVDPATGRPVDNIKWKKDTPHADDVEVTDEVLLTAENIWLASASTGDYHDNMNGEQFMKWVKNKLMPTFKRMFPGKKMVLVMDNAPYHHVREIGTLSGKTKGGIIDLMKKYEVDHILLPLTDERKALLESLAEGHGHVVEDGHLRVPFDEEGFKKTKSKYNSLTTPTADELKVGFVVWLKKNKPDALRCKIEKFIEDEGGAVLWTPPYCPDLQPIELFWAAGKNNVSLNYYHGRSCVNTVKDLRDGWYGNLYKEGDEMVPRVPEGEDPDVVELLDPSDCGKLVAHSIKCANTRVEAVPGISGKVDADGQLTIDPAYQRVDVAPTAVPIDTLVNTALEGVNAQAEEEEVETDGNDGPVSLTGDVEEFSLDGLADDLDVDVEDVFSDEDDE